MLIILFLAGTGIFLAATLITLLPVLRAKNATRQIALWLGLLASVVFLGLSLQILITQQSFHITLYQIVPSLRLSLDVDRLAAFFMMLISLVSVSSIIYSMGLIKLTKFSPDKKGLMVSAISIFILSMLLLVASDNSFSFIFFWEIMSLSSFFLVLFDFDKKESQKSGLFYFVMTQMSTAFLLFGFLTLFGVTGSFDMKPVADISPSLKTAVFASLFIGFGIKAGVMPFHKWLPYAHSASPSNVSALMSGVMIKVAIYGMVRYFLQVLNPEPSWGVAILIFGSFSALMGIIYALKEYDIKKLLAYSSIENVGIILLSIGLYIILQSYGLQSTATLALLGGLFHTFNHALFKSLLFFATGSVANAAGTRNIEKMGGLIKPMPYTGIIFLIGAVSISALPPFNGFVSELMIFQAFLQSFIITSAFIKILLLLGLSMFALTSALAAVCFVKAFGIIFLAKPRSKRAEEAHEAPIAMLIGPAIPAALCILLGVFSSQISSLLGFKLPIPDLMIIGALLIIFLALTWILLHITTNRKTRVSETWGCGIVSQSNRMEYTATGFSEPILTIFQPIYRTRKDVERTFMDNQSVVFKEGKAEITTLKIFEEKIYLQVARFVERMSTIISKYQDVDLDVYILYSLVAVIILLLVAGWIT
ncbi:MAG: proton-conducting transporter membrane subunit [Dehalococcoidales bacterium]|nr:proton-conducting transporter membrane subunit [Dehalococcoidales bacterium]